MNLLNFFKSKKRKLEIGSYKLTLDPKVDHERRYLSNSESIIDTLIAKEYIRSGDIVLDAGANIGFTALQYLRFGAEQVYAFEPVPHVYCRLASIKTDRIYAFNLGLSNISEEREIILSKSHDQGHTFKLEHTQQFSKVYSDNFSKTKVKVVALDQIVEGVTFDFMKIDIEGSEVQFLQGASQTLRANPPRILQIEIYPYQYEAVHSEISQYFTHSVRVGIDFTSNTLKISQSEQDLDLPQCSFNPPVYLYSNHPKLLTPDCKDLGRDFK